MSDEKIKHVAFIMDGNRRWARSNRLEVLQGHTRGADNIRPLVEYASEQGIKYVTFWAFSTENWKREEREVSYLLDLFRSFITGEQVQELLSKGVRLRTIGDMSKFPEDIQASVAKVEGDSRDNTGVTVTIALNYGGREEIIHSIKNLLGDMKSEKLKVESFGADDFERNLYTAGVPDPDIIVRTGGEMRLSGFMPWQSVYSELFFVDTLWPDFSPVDFARVLAEFDARERRFGK